ncbi:MAG: phosphotransferase [Acidimicrobiia bacterium]
MVAMEAAPRWERVGDTVHRTPGGNAEFVRALLRYLEAEGFAAAPRLLGVDEHGRDVLSFAEGFVAPDLDSRRWRPVQIEAAFKLLRAFHHVTEGSALAGGAEVVCHNDFTPQNVVFRAGLPVMIIDWEFAGPGSRRRDLAHGLWQWLNIGPDGPPVESQGAMAKRVLQAYGVVPEADIVDVIRARQQEWLQLATGAAATPTVTMNRTAEHWASTAIWVQRELTWFDANADRLRVSIEG